jgi:hypothetical protein
MGRRDRQRGGGSGRCLSLIGSFAESATYVRQRRVSDHGDGSTAKLRFEAGTGELEPDTRFAPHGHVVVINVAGVL